MSSRILIINSCGKAKAVSHPNQPHWEDLQTKEQREKAKEKFSSLLTPAGDLYTGPQATAVRKAIKILRRKTNVDLYIISAGFGLVEEHESLPPYESTFTGLGKKAIFERAKKLEIPTELQKLMRREYDLVYLALGQDYLNALGNLASLKELGKEIVHFNTKLSSLPANFKGFNSLIFVGEDLSSSIFKEPIGATIAAKGTILLNFALEYNKGLTFTEWWQSKLDELKQIEKKQSYKQTKLVNNSESSEIKKITYNHTKHGEINQMRKEAYKCNPEHKIIIEQIVKKELQSKDFEDIAKACRNLRSPNTRGGETRQTYVKKYEKHLGIFRKIIALENTISQKINRKNLQSQIIGEIADNIRKNQQRLGITKNLLNTNKLVLMKIILRWVDNPDELKKEFSFKAKKESLKSKPTKKISEKAVSRHIVSKPDIEIEIEKIQFDETQTHFSGFITNKSDYPLQNLELKLVNEENEEIPFTNASGNQYIEMVKNRLFLHFIAAPMKNDEVNYEFDFTVAQIVDEENMSLIINYDLPAKKRKIKETFQLESVI